MIAGFLAAMAGLSVLVRGRWREAEVLGILSTALSVALWMQRFFSPTRAGDAYLVALARHNDARVVTLDRGLAALHPKHVHLLG